MKKKLRGSDPYKIPRLNGSEVSFIYDCCKWFLGKKDGISKPEGIRDELVFEYLRKNGFTGIFFKCLEDADIPVPAELSESYRGEYLAGEMKNTVYMKTVERIADVCKESGINYVMIKGAALLDSVYKDRGLRPLSDIDLIVESREEALRLIEALHEEIRSGDNFFAKRYKDYVRTICFIHDRQFDQHIEVEFNFPVKECFYPLPELFFNISGRLFSRSRQANNIRIPDPSSHFLVLMVHLIHHHLGARLIWYLDMALLIDKYSDHMEWDVIVRECGKLEFEKALFHILKLLKETFGVDVPETVLKKVGKKPRFNKGYLEEMVSARNVIMDSLGGGKIWQFPTLSFRKLKTFIFYGGIPFSINDQLHPWYTLNLGSKRNKRIMGDQASVLFFEHKYAGKKTIFKKIMGGFIVILFSLIALPVLTYFNFKRLIAPGP